MEAIVKVEKLVKSFSDRNHVLKGVDLSFEAHTFNVLLGQSGSGKSTLLNILSGLLKPTSGQVIIDGEDIHQLAEKDLAFLRRNKISNIYQDYMLLPELTVRENIELGLGLDNLDFGDLVQRLGISHLLDKYPDQLSGGQQQRVAIARAIIKKPQILFCDEATGALDEENSKEVIELLHHLAKHYDVTVIFATHNLKVALMADRVITMTSGQLVQDKYNESPLLPSEIDWGMEI